MSGEATPYQPRCKNLNCKSMIVYGEAFENDPEYQGGETDFWCLRTSRPFGPDGELASMKPCSNPERGCFEEF